MDSTEETWVTLSEAWDRVIAAQQTVNGFPWVLGDLARGGSVRSRAKSLTIGSDHRPFGDIPIEAWERALGQHGRVDWHGSLLQCQLRSPLRSPSITLKAFGIEFLASDLANFFAEIPKNTNDGDSGALAASAVGGRSLADHWPNFVAELCAWVYEEGNVAGLKNDQLIAIVNNRLAERGIVESPRSTVLPAIKAVIERLSTS